MRKLALFAMLMVAACVTSAQNYRMLHANSEYFFEEADWITGLKNDSVAAAGADSVFYPYRTLFYNDTTSSHCNVTPDHPTWAGSRIIASPSLRYTWFNLTGDSIHFHPAAGYNDTFTVYRYPSGNLITAFLSSKGIMNVAGAQDSVKVFTMRTVSPSGNAISGDWNDREVIVSKNNGVVQMPAVRDFPGSIVMVSRTAGKRLRYSDIYTWQPGDELHDKLESRAIQQSGTSYIYWYNLQVLSRTQITPDSVVFALDRKTHYIRFTPPANTITADTIIIGVGRLNEYIHEEMPLQTIDSSYYYFLYRDACSRLTMQEHYKGVIAKDSCLHHNTFEPYFNDAIYTEGVAGYYSTEQPHYINQLSNRTYLWHYYSIGGNTCGTPYYVGVNAIEKARLAVWPNPANDMISWCDADNNGEYSVTIYDGLGRELETHSKEACGTVSVAHLAPGLYPVVFRSGSGSYHHRLIIQR